MTTTALYVELIVIGVQVELWMLILVDIFYRGVVKSLIGFADNAFIIIAALIPAYVLGMIFDRIADRVFYRRERKIKKDSGLQTSSSILIEETPKMHEFQLYSRSKYRVLRATTLNLPNNYNCFTIKSVSDQFNRLYRSRSDSRMWCTAFRHLAMGFNQNR